MAYIGAPTSTAAQHGYIGKAPASASFAELTDISGSFNGSTQTFALQSGGGSISPASVFQTIVALDGVVQEPGTAYTISGSNITFTGSSGPASSVTFWGIVMGEAFSIGVPGDATVDADALATGAVTSVKILDGTIANTDFAAAAVDTAAIKALAVDTGELAASAVTSGKIADSAVIFNKLNANTAHFDRTQSFTAPQRGTVTDIGSQATTVTVNLDTTNNHKVELTGNAAFASPTGLDSDAIGQSGSIFISQDSGGSNVPTFHAAFDFIGGTVPTFTTTGDAVDRLDYIVVSATRLQCVVTLAYS